MADTKITALAAITTVDPAADVLPIVDISDTSMAASGTTKKITSNQILGAGGTATLASATITGDLTVDTSTLVVDSTNNRVGILTATPRVSLDVASGNGYVSGQFDFGGTGPGANAQGFLSYSGGNAIVGSYGNTSLLFYTNGAEQMRLNSTGLGVGGSPSYQIHARKDQAAFTSVAVDNQSGLASGTGSQFLLLDAGTATGWFRRHRDGTDNTDIGYKGSLRFRGAITGTERTDMLIDASGNLLVGKTARDLTTAGVELLPSGQTTVIVASSVGGFTTSEVYSTTAAAYRFYVGMNGTVSATNTTISAISDARLKENVQDIDVGLAAILALKPRKFDWKAGKGKDIKGDRGFIAQEFETVFPNLIDEWKDEAPEGEAPYKSVRQDLIPVLVKAIQELTARVQTLEAK